VNKEIEVEELEQQYGGKEKTIQVCIRDKDTNFNFRISEGRLKYVKSPKQVDAKAITDSDTFLSLLSGKTKVIDPVTGEEEIESYTPYDAYLRGRLKVYGKGTTNDMYLLFNYIWDEVQETIEERIGSKLAKVIK